MKKINEKNNFLAEIIDIFFSHIFPIIFCMITNIISTERLLNNSLQMCFYYFIFIIIIFNKFRIKIYC